MISIVVPALNEVENISRLHEELSVVAKENDYDIEFIFIDDGSTDGTWEEILALADADQRVRGFSLRKQFGKSAALSVGFEASRGDIVFTLDGDLQDNPKELPRFLERLDDGFDVVSGWKKVRHDPWHKVGPSRVFNWLVSWMTGVKLHDHNCGYKCYRRDVFQGLQLYGDLHRFIPVLAAAQGWRIGEIVVDHRARTAGISKYGITRIPKGLLDLFTVKLLVGYGKRPQHFLGMVGLAGFAAGSVGIVWLTAAWFLSRVIGTWAVVHLHERALFFYSLAAMLLGAQLMGMGFLAALFTASHGNHQPGYSLRATTDGDGMAITSLTNASRPQKRAAD